MTAPKKPFRESMPRVFEFLSAAREVFGPGINAAISAGLDGQPTFWATENRVEAGTPPREPGYSVSGDALLAHRPMERK